MKAISFVSAFSRREKLLLTLLSSTLLFSFSFSYGAMNQSKLDAIMKTITDAGDRFPSQTDRDTYYRRVYTGLSEAVALLITVQNNVGAMIGTAPVTVPPVGTPPISGNPLELCSADTEVESVSWPLPTGGDPTHLMKITDTKSRVFKFVVPAAGTNMVIETASTPTLVGRRIQKLYYALSQQKACAYTSDTLGYKGTFQAGGSMTMSVFATAPTAPYIGTPKLSPGTWYLSFKAQQPLTSADDPAAPFSIYVNGGTAVTGGPGPVSTDNRMGSCKTTVYAGSYSSASTKIDCTQAHNDTGSEGYGSLNLLQCNVDYTNTLGSLNIRPVSKGGGNFVIEYKPGIQGTYMSTAKYWTFTINAQTPGIGQADTRVAKLEVAISSQPNDFTSSNVIQKGTSIYIVDQGLLTYREFSPMLIMPRDYPHKLYINVRPLTYHDMTKGTRYADEEITESQVSSRGLSLPTQSFYLIPNLLPDTGTSTGWKVNFTQANYCLAGTASNTTPPTGGPGPVSTAPTCINVTPTKLEIINLPVKPATIDPADIGPGKVVLGQPLPPFYAKKYTTTLTTKQSVSGGATWCDMVGGGGNLGGGCSSTTLNGNPTSYPIGSSAHTEVLANGIIRDVERYDKTSNTYVAIPVSERKGVVKYILDDTIEIPRCSTTTTPPSPPNPPTPPTPAPVTNPIANYPIPAPCMAGTVINKELMGVNNGAWIRREFSRATDIVPGHVYKLRIDEEDGQGDGRVLWSDAPPERIMQTVKISPYPCDFVTLEQEKKYFGDRIKVAASLTTWWDSVTVPATTELSTCMSVATSSSVAYKIGAAFSSPNIASMGTCTLVKGVTYYVNVRPSFTHMHGNGCNGTYACNYDLVDGGSQKMPSSRPPIWGVYNTYEEFLVFKTRANASPENVEALRQKVVNDYATKGVNSDGLTNTALGGTAVTPPPVSTGGGPVVVREGPWERVEDIFCPDTLANLRASYPNSYNYYNQGNTYWNVKNYLTPTDNTLPASCTTGTQFVKHGMSATCYVYECKN